MAVSQSPAQMMAVLKSWGVDPYELLSSIPGYKERFGSGTTDPAKEYLARLESQLGDFSTEGKSIRLVASGDDDIGLFPSFHGISSALGFDGNGQVVVHQPQQANMPGMVQVNQNSQYDPYTGMYSGYNPGTGQQFYGNNISGFGSLLAQPYGMGTFNPQPFDYARDVGDNALRQALQKGIYEGRASPFSNDDAINDVFSRPEYAAEKPMTMEQYFRESQKQYSATMSDGSTMSGPGLFNYMDGDQQAQALSAINSNYNTYMNEYRNAAVNFLNNQNQTAWNKQAATDTDPRNRQVAQYGETGSYAPTGQSGWGRGSVQSSEGFQDVRKRGWGQSETQGV